MSFSLSFGHNLCFNHPNGSCEPISYIYVPRAFQWYKELHNSMGFDPCNCSMKIHEFIGTLTLKVGAHLGVWEFIQSHSPTLLGAWDVIPKLHSWLAPLQTFALITSPRLRLWQSWWTTFFTQEKTRRKLKTRASRCRTNLWS